MFTRIKVFLDETPKEVLLFLKRATLIFIFWKLLYHLLLYPIRQPDKWLTDLSTNVSANVIKIVKPNIITNVIEQESLEPDTKRNIVKSELWLNGKKVVRVGDGCNGLELYVIYIGFLWAFWKGWKRFIVYLILGVITIFIINTGRIVGLGWVTLNYNKWFDFLHGYAFKLVVYSVILFFWFLYGKESLTKK